MPRYQFKCGSCQYGCIGSIGVEQGIHSFKASMLCGECKEINSYTISRKGGIDDKIENESMCKSCGSDKHLKIWDGLTCPKCTNPIRAIGYDVDATKSSRFKWRV